MANIFRDIIIVNIIIIISLGEESELACLCLVSALVIQPVLLRSVLRRFVHVTRSDVVIFCNFV